MKINTLSFVSVVGFATAARDLSSIKSASSVTEEPFILSTTRIRGIDTASSISVQAPVTVTVASVIAPAASTPPAITTAQDLASIYLSAGKTLNRFLDDVSRNSGPAIVDAVDSVNKAMNPDVRNKIKKAINTFVDSVLDAAL